MPRDRVELARRAAAVARTIKQRAASLRHCLSWSAGISAPPRGSAQRLLAITRLRAALQAATREHLPPGHPLRRLIWPFTLGSVSINYAAMIKLFG